MADTVRVRVEIENGQQAVDMLTKIQEIVNGLNGKSATIHINQNDVTKLSQNIKTINDAVSTVNRARIAPQVETSGIDRLVNGLQTAANIAGSIGTAVGGVNSFIGGIGNAFTGMSDLFSIDLLNTSKRYLTAMATRMVTENIGDIISRYDILSTFTPYMQIAGVSPGTADAALQRVNQSILGLPIGLDEAAYRLRRYQMFVGDTEQATNLTIGLQNALTAGGASQSMKNTAYMEMERLLTSGDLATWRQWQALITGFGVSSRFIADAMSELSGKQIDVKELARGLHDGTVEAEDLLKAIEYLGKDWSGETNVPKFVTDMQNALATYKGTLEAWISNIKFAVTRGGANLLGDLNTAMQEQQGVGLTDVLSGVRDTINEIFKAGGGFIQNHPEAIKMAFDAIGGFMDRARGLNWESFGTNVIGNLGKLADLAFQAFDAIPDGALEEFASFAITIAGPAGGLIKLMQAGFPQMLAVFKAFKTFDFGRFLGQVTTHLGAFTTLVGGFLSLFNNNVASNVAAFALVWGPAIVKVANGLRSALEFLATSGILSFLTNPVGLLALGGAALAGGIAYNAYQANAEREAYVSQVNSAYDNSGRITDAKELMDSFTTQTEEWDRAEKEISHRSEIAQDLIREIRDANTGILNESLSDAERSRLRGVLRDNVALWNEMFPEMPLDTYGNVAELRYGTLTEGSELFAKNMADNYLNLQTAEDYLDAYKSASKEAMEDMVKLGVEREYFEEELNRQSTHVHDLIAGREYLLKQQKDIEAQILENGEDQQLIYQQESIKNEIEKQDAAIAQAQENLEKTKETLDELNISYEHAAGFVEKYKVKIEDYLKLTSNLSQQEFFVDGQIKAWENLTQAEQDALAAYEAYLDKERETQEYGGTERTEDKGVVPLSQITGNMDWNNDRYERRDEARQNILDWYSSLSPEDMERAYPAVMEALGWTFEERDKTYGFEQAVEGAKGMIPDVVNGMIDEATRTATNEENKDKVDAAVEVLAESGAEKASETMAVLNSELNGEDYIAAKEAQQQKFRELRDRLIEGMLPGWASFGKKDAKEVAENTAEAAETTTTKMQAFLEPLAKIAEYVEPLETAPSNIEAFAESAETVSPRMEGFLAPLAVISESSKALEDMPGQVEALGESTDSATPNVEGFLAPLQAISESAESSAENLGNANSAASTLGDTASNKKGQVDNFAGSVGNVAGQASTAAAMVNALADAIDRIHDVVANVRVNVSGAAFMPSVTTSRFAETYGATGGWAGYSGPWGSGPKGEDTIPTWLAPGEFIVRKSAAKMFGPTFLEKVNGMDIGGAFDALMHNLARPSGLGYMPNVTFNRDNHATVNNYFSGETGQGYSQRKAYAWASKL